MPFRQPAQLADVNDEELERLCASWRTKALRGDRRAYGIAHALEVERRRRTRDSQLQSLPPELTMSAQQRPWWKFWPARKDGSSVSSM
ncbi:hypothetical protein RCH10_004453 [Variovorax sp. GrIS 2.14]|uniref:hypothetical protein n=1 Tax=Variovorax sp. GrIS 2.14 TaxID=3071709 RepID=UPI0038F6D3B2